MPGKDAKPRPPTLLGRAIKTYLDTHSGMTHEKLAAMLDVEPKTISRWKNGETVIANPYELKRIADILGIPYEQLGIPAAIHTPPTPEQIDTIIARMWANTDAALITDARAIGENLARQLTQQIKTSDTTSLRSTARAYNAIAYTTSLNVRTDQVQQAINYYQQMEYFARLLKDDTLINIALTYQGDMLRRQKDIPRAIEYLEAARDTTPEADTIARGNCIQLLARAYLQAHREKDFYNTMREAEELAYATRHETERSVKRYDLATVYEEYARGYSGLGKIQKALDYLNQAEKVKPPTRITEILLRVARAEVLIRGGDVSNGEPLAVQAARECRELGHYRHIERLYTLKRYMSKRVLDYGKAEKALSEALEGPTEF